MKETKIAINDNFSVVFYKLEKNKMYLNDLATLYFDIYTTIPSLDQGGFISLYTWNYFIQKTKNKLNSEIIIVPRGLIFDNNENNFSTNYFVEYLINELKSAYFYAFDVWKAYEIKSKTTPLDKLLTQIMIMRRIVLIAFEENMSGYGLDYDETQTEEFSFKIHSFYEGNAKDYNKNRPIVDMETYQPQDIYNWELYVIFEMKIPYFEEPILLGRTYASLNKVIEKKEEYFIQSPFGYSRPSKFSILNAYSFNSIANDSSFFYWFLEIIPRCSIMYAFEAEYDIIAPAYFH